MSGAYAQLPTSLPRLQGSLQGGWPEYFFTHLMEAYMYLILINVLTLITVAILYGPYGVLKRESHGAPYVHEDMAELLGWGKQVL